MKPSKSNREKKMSEKKTVKQIEEVLTASFEEWLAKANKVYGTSIRPGIRFSNRSARIAGSAQGLGEWVKYSTKIAATGANLGIMCESTVPHEIAHVFNTLIYKGKGHDASFYKVMKEIGMKAKHRNRLNSYLARPNAVKTINCPCCKKALGFTQREVDNIIRGNEYGCIDCKRTIGKKELGILPQKPKKASNTNKKVGSKTKPGPTTFVASDKKQPKKEKKEKKVSAYGTGVAILCQSPDISKDDFTEQMKKAGINVDDNKNATNTAYSAVRSIVARLRENGLMS